MEALIPVISKLQDVFATVGHRESEVQLPQIVVVGSQSAGKSSVIEGIVGRDFLPRGIGVVTRRPLLLHLVHVPIGDPQRRDNNLKNDDEWAVFEHKKSEIFTDFKKVCQEIDEETERVSGSNKGISSIPITLRIFSHKVVNLSLIDLPGITKLPVGDQPQDIEEQIRKLILSYISNPNSLILAVTPANQDFATSEPLKLAREVDFEGDRTLAVLTKLDLMDRGTDALDVLTGRSFPVKLGIIGVVNRAQEDIAKNKSIEDCLLDEARFLLKHYPTLASKNGIQYLAKTLNRLLMHHIRECLPQLKARVNAMSSQCRSLLNSYGEPVQDKNRTLLQLIGHFATAYVSTIEGTSKNIETAELSGGARISFIFHGVFVDKLNEVDPMENFTTLDILTAIRNATGTRPDIFIPVVAFELLVKKQIERLLDPAICCVDRVFEELMRIVQQCGVETQQEMQRFPKLYERINEVVSALLTGRLASTKRFVKDIVYSEMAYINTKHPDFTEAALIDPLKASTLLQVAADKDKTAENAGENKSPLQNGSANQNGIPNGGDIQSSPTRDGVAASLGSWFMGRNSVATSVQSEKKTGPVMERVPGATAAVIRPLTQREQRDCAMFERLIQSYFAIARLNIQDMVPKGVMRFMVNYVKENLQSELVQQLYNNEKIDELLAESEMMAQRRKESAEMLEALNKANHVISEIRETHIW